MQLFVSVDIFPLEAFTIQIKHCQVQPAFELVTSANVIRFRSVNAYT